MTVAKTVGYCTPPCRFASAPCPCDCQHLHGARYRGCQQFDQPTRRYVALPTDERPCVPGPLTDLRIIAGRYSCSFIRTSAQSNTRRCGLSRRSLKVLRNHGSWARGSAVLIDTRRCRMPVWSPVLKGFALFGTLQVSLDPGAHAAQALPPTSVLSVCTV